MEHDRGEESGRCQIHLLAIQQPGLANRLDEEAEGEGMSRLLKCSFQVTTQNNVSASCRLFPSLGC